MGEAPLSTDVDAALAAPAPRTDAQVALLVASGGAGYRKLGLLIWGCVLGIAALVGFTTDGAEAATFFKGFGLGSVMFGLPTQAFVTINLRKLKTCARRGLVQRGVVTKAQSRGEIGSQIAEVVVRFSTPAGERSLWATGVTRSLREGDVATVLFDPAVPGEAGVVVPGLGIVLGRAKAEARA